MDPRPNRPSRARWRAIPAVLLATSLVLVAGVADAGAARRDRSLPATLTASPALVSVGGSFGLYGCGFDASTDVDMVVDTGTSLWFWSLVVDDQGCISDEQRAGQAGSYRLEAYQHLKGKRHTLMAETSLEVMA